MMTPAAAAPISFTGSELLNLTGIRFPSSITSLAGDSLRLNNTRRFGIIAELPLDQFLIDPSQFEVQVDITKLRRDDGLSDQELYIYLSDGFNLFGGVFGDFMNNVDRIAYQPIRAEISNDGLSFIFREVLAPSDFIPAVAGDDFFSTLRVQSTSNGTIVSGDINAGATQTSGFYLPFLDPSNRGFSLVLGGDAVGENIQINSLTFSSGVSVSEPSPLAGLSIAMVLLAGMLYRRRQSLTMSPLQA